MDEEKQEQYQKAKQYLERLLAQHPRTIWEVRTKLQQKKFAREIVEQVIKEFIEAGFLNDESYIKLWLENQIKYRPCGRMLCLKKLLARGLDFSLVNKALDEVFSEEKEFEIADKLISSRARHYQNFTPQQKSPKIASFLKSRGFGDGAIIKLLEKLGLKFEL